MKTGSQILLMLFIISCQSQTFVEKDGYVEVEAEDFHVQKMTKGRTWQIQDELKNQHYENDPDSLEYLTASGGSFIELLPDTRVTHEDELQHGINFSNEPGISVLEYRVRFNTTGKYFVWVRAYSTGTEDNGIHVGIDGYWPDSGQRMQWCEGKNQWTWESKQRTDSIHCGEPEKIFLLVDKPGLHSIQFSMREDGFAFDKFALSTNYEKPGD